MASPWLTQILFPLVRKPEQPPLTMAWAKMANDQKQMDFLLSIGEKNKWQGGPDQRFFADDYVVEQTYAQLYQIIHAMHQLQK